MFSYPNHKQFSELNGFVRRLTNLTSPNVPRSEGENRAEMRNNRTFAVLLVPCDGNDLAVHDTTTAVTKDLSEQGISLVLNQPFQPEVVVLGFWPVWDSNTIDAQPTFVRGHVRQNAEIGGGFWQIGVQFEGKATEKEFPTLDQVFASAARLIPRSILRHEETTVGAS